MKIWRGNEHSDDKIIAFTDLVIYKGNPKTSEIDDCITGLKNGVVPTQSFTAIPLNYIKEIKLQEGKRYIEVLFGKDSYEHLKIGDILLKNEIFNYLKQKIPKARYSFEKYSTLRAGKKPLIAMMVIIITFIWSLYYAIDFDKGIQYDIKNGHYNSITGIVLAIASYGVKNVLIVFGSFLVITVIAFIKKIQHPPVIMRLKIIQ